MSFSLSSTFRLKSPKAVSAVFMGGTTVRYGNLLLHFRLLPVEEVDFVPVKMAFAVSKRRFKKSVDRNYVKRLMRECYRVQKIQLPEGLPVPMQMHGVLSYNNSQRPEYAQMNEDLVQLFAKAQVKLQSVHKYDK